MIANFHNDERGYAAWMRAHPQGFVFNHFGGSYAANNIVYRASCAFLRRGADTGSRTVYAKVCGETREEVEAEASRLRDGPLDWKHCGVCMQ